MCPGLAKADATATSDDGLSVLGAAWAREIPRAERVRGGRSARETDRVATARIGAFCGGAPERGLFQGCSTGGCRAMRAALQDPEMFDGIIAGAPAMDYPGLVGTRISDLVEANGAGGGAASRRGRRRADRRGDAVAARRGRRGAGRRGGSEAQPYFSGAPVGSKAFWPGWLAKASDDAAPLVEPFAANVLAGMASPDDRGAGYDPRDFDAGSDPARAGCARPAAALPKAGQRERARS